MRFEYDQEARALYIRLVDDRMVARTVEIDHSTFVDVDEHGVAVGIEVLSPARKWPLEEILDRFALRSDAEDTLRHLFAADRPFPFADKLVAV